MRKRTFWSSAVLLALAVFAASCGADGGDEVGEPEDTVTAEGTSSDGGSTPGDDGGAPQGCTPPTPDSVSAGWVYIGSPASDLSTLAHDEGRLAAAAATGVPTSTAENVDETNAADVEQAIRGLIDEGNNLIFGTAFGYMDTMEALADEFPDVAFEHVSGFKSNECNFGNLLGRMYQARYLTGMVAGATTTSNIVGYVAPFAVPEVIRGINAFTLGVRATNPDATVRVEWSDAWFDPEFETEAATFLVDGGADVIAMRQDSTAVGEVAEAAGVRWISHNTDMSAIAPQAYLTSTIWNWGQRYTTTIEALAAGIYQPESYWGGIETGIVDIGPLAADVDPEVAAQVADVRAQMVAGEFSVFAGELLDQDGNVVVGEGDPPLDADDQALLGMDFFVDGVDAFLA